jgi:hypothetical protein
VDDLVEFLRDRLDEDEAAARAATPGPWKQSGIGEYGWGVSFSRPGAGVEAEDGDQGRADAEHIARHDPARILAEVEAKRALLRGAEEWEGGTLLYYILAPLARVYCDHPDFDPAWLEG